MEFFRAHSVLCWIAQLARTKPCFKISLFLTAFSCRSNWGIESGCVLSGSHNCSSNKDPATAPCSLIRVWLPETIKFSSAVSALQCYFLGVRKRKVLVGNADHREVTSVEPRFHILVFFTKRVNSPSPVNISSPALPLQNILAEAIGLFVAITIPWARQRLPKVRSCESGRFDCSLASLPAKTRWKKTKLLIWLKTWRQKNTFYPLKKVFSYNSEEIFIYSSYRHKTTKEIEIQRKD